MICTRLANTCNLVIEELEKINSLEKKEYITMLEILGFLVKKGIFERIDSFNWSLSGNIQVDKIDRHNMIPLSFAIQKVYFGLMTAAEAVNYDSEIKNIIDGQHESYASHERSFGNKTFLRMIELAPRSIHSKIYKLIK